MILPLILCHYLRQIQNPNVIIFRFIFWLFEILILICSKLPTVTQHLHPGLETFGKGFFFFSFLMRESYTEVAKLDLLSSLWFQRSESSIP